ncbi:hypothetical protein GGS26DRAFT_601344 [Hypomontagnella submonticulosa]|nr:hypothetical protein GGS26DRAFT_601344 [Hypomontagnella submonticulosa]
MMKKRIIVCCDGTWQNSDNGYVKPTSSKPIPTLQIPSNVTRISRAFKRNCSDGTFQIVYYHSGVGTGPGAIVKILGGAFGIGIAENIREAYSYICANYVDGDEIILIGFSRGAFTARSVGGMISDLGLLTREGMEFFYPVFKDMQNWMSPKYKDQFPTIPFPDKPKGPQAPEKYRKMLLEKGYTRVHQENGKGNLISVTAIGVWDTVGSLGIPQGKLREILGRLGLDETRGPFSPTLWERQPQDQDVSDLRQVWFPGTHGNIGGGWADQGVANGMMDQLSSVGCEFIHDAVDRLYNRNVQYYHSLKSKELGHKKGTKCCCGCCTIPPKTPLPWAVPPIFDPEEPVRPWSLHGIRSVKSPLYGLAGSVTRSPGMYKKINPENSRNLRAFLKNTNERIHSSVRVRLACEGLGPNDSTVWDCPALLKMWRPRRIAQDFVDPVPHDAGWGPNQESNGRQALGGITNKPTEGVSAASGAVSGDVSDGRAGVAAQENNPPQGLRWVWEYIGPDARAPYDRILVEETMGPWEKHLLELSSGKVHVCEYASTRDVSDFRAFASRVFTKKSKRNKSSP